MVFDDKDIQEFLNKNRKAPKRKTQKGTRKPEKNLFEDDEHEHSHPHIDVPPGETAEQHARHERDFGKMIMNAIRSGKSSGIIEIRKERDDEEGENRLAIKDLYLMLKRQQELIGVIARHAKMKPGCKDANGKSLKVGDMLHTSDSPKKVLEVGYGYALLSISGSPKEVDGYWYEQDIIKHEFYK